MEEKEKIISSETLPEDQVPETVAPESNGQNNEAPGIAPDGYYRGANALKFLLMPFVCIASFGFPGPFGDIVSRFCLFAPIAFYILCGFTLAANEEEEPGIYGRMIGRTVKQFALIFMILIVMNLFLMWLTGSLGSISSLLHSRRSWFNIVVLCTWPFPIGETIWFIQSLLYARIILFIMDRIGLMRHYKIVLIVTALLTVLLGEFAGIIRFHFLGYYYIPGNAITRALPYMLFGRLLYEKRDSLFKRSFWFYRAGFIVGILAALGEMFLLAATGLLIYTGHMIGFGVMAFSACCLFLKKTYPEENFLVMHGRTYPWRIYVLSQPVGNLLVLWGAISSPAFYGVMRTWGGIIVYIVCLGIASRTRYILHLLRPVPVMQ